MDKVEISKSSAIWRYYRYLNCTQARIENGKEWHDKNLNFCTFVRRIILWTIFFAIRFVLISVLAALLVGGIVGGAVFVVYWPIAHGWVLPAEKDGLSQILLLLGSIVWLLVAFSSFVYLYVVVVGDRTKPEKPNLLGAWIRAKKQKVCPLIELKD